MNKQRIRKLNNVQDIPDNGPIVYWMNRDQRFIDNWAVIYGMNLAKKHDRQFTIVFSLRKNLDEHLGTKRMVDFMLAGLEEVEQSAKKYGVGFYFLTKDPVQGILDFVNDHQAAVLISDFSPISPATQWKRTIANDISIPFFEVDTHNIVPCWITSDKQEYAARTIRPKINKHLDEFLDEFPKLETLKNTWESPVIKWDDVKKKIKVISEIDATTFKPGSKAGYEVMENFLELRLKGYDQNRNDPYLNHLSQLSPYLHFGQISAQRVALEVRTYNDTSLQKDKEAFLEELIVRRELSDNYCFYNPDYKSVKGFANWAQQTLRDHESDKREYVYSLDELEQAKTHDEAWNAAQMEMVKTGKMHGYMRMYWAKKILEWTESADQAMEYAIYLNDLYSLDGRDPNGYVGIAWSIGGVHDRGWTERPVFGKIRYMNYNGLKRKFNIQDYIDKISKL